MPVTMSQVLAEIDKDEPDYQAAARLGPEALPHLRLLIDADDAMRASKAAYLAGLIGGAEATSVLQDAAAHRDPIVRVAAAHAVSAAADVPQSLLERLLDDGDAGVRRVALRAAATVKSAQIRDRISAMAKTDPDENIRKIAEDVAKRP